MDGKEGGKEGREDRMKGKEWRKEGSKGRIGRK